MPPLDDIRYDRLCRTSSSESYLVSRGDEPLGRVELHFTSSAVHGMLVLEQELAAEELDELLEQLDEDLVWSADTPRDDFIITVYQGREVGVYSDSEEDTEANGHGERL